MNSFMLYREIIAVYCLNRRKQTNTPCGVECKVLCFKLHETLSDHLAVSDLNF